MIRTESQSFAKYSFTYHLVRNNSITKPDKTIFLNAMQQIQRIREAKNFQLAQKH